jgi:hypothetical protein
MFLLRRLSAFVWLVRPPQGTHRCQTNCPFHISILYSQSPAASHQQLPRLFSYEINFVLLRLHECVPDNRNALSSLTSTEIPAIFFFLSLAFLITSSWFIIIVIIPSLHAEMRKKKSQSRWKKKQTKQLEESERNKYFHSPIQDDGFVTCRCAALIF